MTPARRLVLDTVDGRLVVRDRERPAARLVEIGPPGEAGPLVAEHLCGWVGDAASAPLWATPQEALEALTRDEAWAGVLQAAAMTMAAPAGAPLPAADAERIAALHDAHPGLWMEGPHQHPDGGWYVVLCGASDVGWALGRGESPHDAAMAALAQVEAA